MHLMIRVAAISTCAALMMSMPAAPAVAQVVYATPTGWRDQPEATFGFSVETPAEVHRSEDSQDLPSLSLDFRDQGGQVMVQVVDFGRAGGVPNVAPDLMLDGMADDLASEHQMVLVSKQATVVNGAVARDAIYRSDALNISMKIRFILAQNRLYTLTGVGLADGSMPPGYDRVIGSFKLLAPPPLAPGSR